MSKQPAPQQLPAPGHIDELRVTAHMMTLDAGLFCIVSRPVAGSDPVHGLPGVRITVAPGSAGRPDAVTVRGFRDDGWLSGTGDATLVRVVGGSAQILVTVYQKQGAADAAPNLQVMRLTDQTGAMVAGLEQPAPAVAAPVAAPVAVPVAATGAEARKAMDLIAHIQSRGDVGCMLGDWMGEAGSRNWVEGFAIAPTQEVLPADIEYQAVLGRGWLSPWAEGGQFCGSRGMALPVLGLRVRLRGAAAQSHECSYSASFVDGTKIGPVAGGDACEAESLAPLEAFQVVIHKRGAAPVPAPTYAPTHATVPVTPQAAAKPAAKPVEAKPKPKPAPKRR